VPRRVAIAVLEPPVWGPPGADPGDWRMALAEDVLDVLALMTEVDPAVAVAEAERGLLDDLGWPGLRSYVLPALDVRSVFAAAAGDGYEQAVALPADAPDLPGMVIAKLLRPLTTRPVAAANATGAPALIGLAANLPAPDWIPAATLAELTPQSLRRLAPAITDVAPGTAWHRLLGPGHLPRLDPRLEGWDATRALLEGRPS
jgi:hypothetical protein